MLAKSEQGLLGLPLVVFRMVLRFVGNAPDLLLT